MTAASPGLFVVLWSNGFIGQKLVLPYMEYSTFLELRFLLLYLIRHGAAAGMGLAMLAEWLVTTP